MTVLVAVLQAVLVAYAPGAALFRLPWGERAQRSRLPAEERVFWQVVLSLAVSLGVALALAAGGVYSLGRLLSVNGAVVLAAIALARGRLRLEAASAPTPAAVLPVAVLALGTWLFFPTAEYVMGGKDPGVYISEGVQIAQGGALSINDPLVASVPASFRDLVFNRLENQPYYGTRFMGFFLFDPSIGKVVGQFPHLFPASIAITYGIAGLDGARAAVALWALLGLVAAYLVGVRVIGRAGAFLATVLLAVNVIEVWYGRYPNAEVAQQALLLAAVLAADHALEGRNRFFEVVAGGLLGLLLFLRFDSVLGIAGVIGAATLASLRGQRLGWRFFVVLGAVGVLAAWYMADLLIGYTLYPLGFVANLPVANLIVLSVSGALVLALLFRGHRWTRTLGPVARIAPVALACTVVGLGVYAYAFRHPEGTLAPHDAYALRTFAWYVTPPGLLAALAAVLLLLPRLFWRSPAFFATAATFSLFFFYKIRVVPEHFWMTRRFLPVILPATLIMIVALAVACVDPDGPCARWLLRSFPESGGAPVRRRRRRVQLVLGALALGLVAALGISFWRASTPIRPHVEYAGMIGHLSRILEHSSPDDLLIVEARPASDMHVLALPLDYVYGRDVLVLTAKEVNPQLMSGFVAWARERYRDVYFLGQGRALLSRDLGVVQVWSDVFWVPEYASPRNAYPTAVKLKEFRYQQCRLLTGQTARTPIVPLDDVHLVAFHDTERDRRGSWRWTRGASEALLTNIEADTGVVSISMENGGRPASAPPAVVEVTLAGRLLGRVAVGEGARPYTFAVPRDLALELAASPAPARLRLTVSPWVPRVLLGTGDDRELGVMVSRIEVGRSPDDARAGVSSPEPSD